MAAANAHNGNKVRPHFTFAVLVFGFLVVYNLLSLPPIIDVIKRIRLTGNTGIDLAIPAIVIVLAIWGASVLLKERH
jgi:F0F1-type ATP synthase membrane subunit a